jgi:hypothetical protein
MSSSVAAFLLRRGLGLAALHGPTALQAAENKNAAEAAALVSSPAPPLPFLTPDSEFKGVAPPEWVRQATGTVFMGLQDLDGIEAAAAAGVPVLHTGGLSVYYPLRLDNPASGVATAEREVMEKGIAKAKGLGMRVILGISPYAPVEYVRQHPDWLLHGTDDPAVREKVKLDLTLPETIGLRSLPLNTLWGDYAIDCLTEIMRDFGVDGFSFDGCYHAAINFSPWERAVSAGNRARSAQKGGSFGCGLPHLPPVGP